jgi:hypothetical protein
MLSMLGMPPVFACITGDDCQAMRQLFAVMPPVWGPLCLHCQVQSAAILALTVQILVGGSYAAMA